VGAARSSEFVLDARAAVSTMNSRRDNAARLSRGIQTKLGEKLALLYVPVLRQRVPNRLSELLRRLEGPKTKSGISRIGNALRLRRGRPPS
jgi:hypothetical protein